jgi:hypothetical protein
MATLDEFDVASSKIEDADVDIFDFENNHKP